MTTKPPNKNLKPLAVESDDIVFDEPWQAQVLAMADLLIQSNQISANDWSAALGSQLKSSQNIADGLISDKQNYYKAALAALTQLIDNQNIISEQQLQTREDDWKNAYLSTPHGMPVVLD